MSGSSCPFTSSTPGTKRLLALSPSPSIYEKLGGREAVRTAVDIFYIKLMKDKRVSHYFKDVSMPKLRSKQLLFMMLAFGGPKEYTGRSLYEAHHGLNLTDDDFTAVTEVFVRTLTDMQVKQQLIDECVAVVASVKDQVVGH